MSDIEHKLSQSEAFLCGRLLRILESAQYYALGDVNATVVDKFYAAASTTPAIVFGHLMGKLQTHLSKGKKSPAPKTIKPPRTAEDVKGTVRNLEYRVAEISAALSSGRGFPKIFTPEEQGAFALGFYSERLRRRKEDPVADQEIEDATDSPDTDTTKD
jgi:CRISPR-associated protein Csd1